MVYMDGDAVFADGIQELSFDEIGIVNGGDRGDATVAGAFAGAAAGYRIAQGASWGARLGAFAGPAGAVVGGIGGGTAAYVIYRLAMH